MFTNKPQTTRPPQVTTDLENNVRFVFVRSNQTEGLVGEA